MSIDSLRLLLYPLGFFASTLFGMRVLAQWLSSEKRKKSYVNRSFWLFSLAANSIMVIHSLIQLQYPVCMIQMVNGVIAWRNLDLLKAKKVRKKRNIVFLMAIFGLGITFLFILQGYLFHSFTWMRPPSLPWEQNVHSPFWAWHLMGITGMFLFASRFWIQWWFAEKEKISSLSKSFWWTSLIGTSICVVYFFRLHDLVNLLSYALGVIPYIRNLMLQSKTFEEPVSLQKNSLFVFAGEQSGDLLGGALLLSLKEKRPSLYLYGVGGEKMQEAGLKSVLPIDHFQVMGFSAVLKALPRLFSSFKKLEKQILRDLPKAVLLIDYPDFTMRLEKSLRKKGYSGKLIHYVCPTVWAWRKSRIKTLSSTLDLLLTVFPFEKKFFPSLAVTYVGHPLVKAIDNYSYEKNWKELYQIPKEASLLAIFPGSRSHEIKANLLSQLQAAHLFCKEHPGTVVAISVARESLKEKISLLAQKSGIPFTLIPAKHRYECMQSATLALATSGTITLELALHQTPTVVTYQIGTFNYFLGKYLFRIRLPFFCIVNIIAGEKIFPECFERTLSSSLIFQEAHTLFQQRDSVQKTV